MGKEKVRDLGQSINDDNSSTTPICRCRVMYLGSSVPHATKDGLQGIQEPLRELYPESGLEIYGSAGIDSWISVWSNGILIENVDDSGREVKRFYPIESLHYCAAVRYVVIPSASNSLNDASNNGNSSQLTISDNDHHHTIHSSVHRSNSNSKNCEKVAKFLPLDSPFLRNTDTHHPPLFACILRRTSGIKVLECHAFICKREPAANALVRCCFHAYADSMYAKQIEDNPYSQIGSQSRRRSRSISALDKLDSWTSSRGDHDLADGASNLPVLTSNGHRTLGNNCDAAPSEIGATSTISHSPDEDNYNKPWSGPQHLRPTSDSMMMSIINNGSYLRSPAEVMNGSLMRGIGPPLPPPPPPNGKVPRYVLVPPSSVLPPPPAHPAFFGIPFIGDPEKVLKQSLKKRKKKSSKYKLPNPMMIAPPHLHPSQLIPNGMIQVPQCPPQGPPPQIIHSILGNGNSIHPSHIPPPVSSYQPPPPSSTAYTIRGRLRRGPPLPAAALMQQSDSYPIMFASDEPVYIPPMRPLTPLSNMHPSNYHPHHSIEPHYVAYPIQNYGTTPRRSMVNGDKLRNDRGIIISNRNGNGSSGGHASGDDHDNDPDREASPNVGLYKRKGHLNERAFSYSIRQEHRSLSNSLANLQFDDAHVVNGSQIIERRLSSNNSEQLPSQSQHHSTNGRLTSHQQHSANDVHTNNNNHHHHHQHHNGDIRKNSLIIDDHHRQQPPPHLSGLSQSLANLNLNGYPSSSSNNKDIPKTASIKRSSKQRTSLGSRGGLPVAPPVLPGQMVKNGS